MPEVRAFSSIPTKILLTIDFSPSSQAALAKSSVEIGNDVAGNIMGVIERERVDMVLISTHGISGWHPLVFGSIAEKVVKLVECPLLLLRSAKPESGVKTGPGRSMEWW